MPKKSTGFNSKGAGQTSPVAKADTPMKTPSIKANSLPTPIAGNVATMPGSRFPKLTRPAPMAPRTPKI